MSDAVGLGINPPPSGFDMLNSILGIQQKKQQLQIQQQQLQQQQLVTEAQKGIQSYFGSVDPNAIHGDDGTLDINKVRSQPQYQSLSGVQRVAVEAKANELQGQGIQLKQGLQTLNTNALTQLGQAAFAAKDSPDAVDQITRLASSSPETMRVMQPFINNWKQAKDPQMLSGALANFAKMTSSITTQQQRPTAYDYGPAIQTASIDPFTGLPTAFGPRITKGLAPTEQPAYRADVAAKTAEAETTATGAAQRAAATQTRAAQSPMAINAFERARDIVERNPDVLRGQPTPAFQSLRSTLAGVSGLDVKNAADTNELAKQLAYGTALRAHGLGLGDSDAGRELAVQGSPNLKGDAQSLPKLLRQSIAVEKYNIASANAQASQMPTDQRLKMEQALRNPQILDAFEASSMRSKPEMDNFLQTRKMTREQLNNLVSSIESSGIKIQ